jgi:predicted site-specific integrase-resolvase
MTLAALLPRFIRLHRRRRPVQASKPLRAALYARVSTADQTTENQLLDLRRYAEARAWQATEYVDQGV